MSAENTKLIELLQEQNQNLIQENTSKNTIIKIIVENHAFDNSNSKLTVSEEFVTVNNKRSRPSKHKKVDLNCSNRYETKYILTAIQKVEMKILMTFYHRICNGYVSQSSLPLPALLQHKYLDS